MIIKNQEGRWHTVRTDAESLESLYTSIDRMTPEERKLLRMVFSQLVKNDTTVVKTIQNLEYEETPTTPETFLSDPYYFGEIGKGLYPWVKEDVIRVFRQGFEELVLTGAQRTGKDTFAHVALSYLLHLLLCLKDPATSYGLAKGSIIHVVLLSATQELAKTVVFEGLIEKVKQSPWFSKFGKTMKILSEEIRFPKGLVVKGAESTDLGVIGLSTCAVIIDEANIGRKVKAVHEKNQLTDRTEAIYQAVKRRIRTTFMKQGRPPTLLMTIGSRRYPSDFVERRIRELQNDKNALCRDLSLWQARGLENFSPKMFKVLVGNDTVQSRVLADGEPPPKGMQVISVPYDFHKDFTDDCEGSLRDIGGISVRTLSPYFSNQKLLREMFEEGRSHPCKTIEWRVDESLEIRWDDITRVVEGRCLPRMHPDKARCVAIDLGRTKNPTGFTVGYVKGFKTVERKQPDGRIFHENLPYIVIEFTLRISPVVGEEVKFWQVRDLIFKFVEHGIPIKYAALDHWQSVDFAQLLTEQGIESTQIKTDIKAYETLKSAIYEGRVKAYAYKPLLDELSMLEYDAKKMKVDTSEEDFGNIHHDVADSVCLLVSRLSRGFRAQDFEPVSPETDFTKRAPENSSYQTVGIGETPFDPMPGEQPSMPIDSSPQEQAPNLSYGLMFNGKDTGWGDEINPKPQNYIPVSKQPIIRPEVLAQEFCNRIGIDKLATVTVDSIKVFLFEKQVTDPRYVNVIKTHIERVYADQLGGKKI